MSIARAISIIIKGSDQASPALKKAKQSMGSTEKAAGSLRGAVGALGMSFGVAGLAGVLKKSVDEFMRFETAVSRIGTLIPGQRALLGTLSDQADLLSRTYGLMADDVATATFQAVSAGVDAGKATEFMAVAAQSATAGFSSMEESVMGLTTIVNAYGLEVSEAQQISDAMFATNKLGVTTTRELSQHMGTVVSVASSLNVGYKEVFASTVALTKQGLNTGRSMVSMRGILASLISPSEDAANAAKQYGLEWDASMVRSRGMVGVMEELQKALASGGTELIARLIPNTRALSGAMALASTTGIKDFNEALTETTTRSGQTAEALKEVTDSASHKYKVATQELASSWRDLGGVSIPLVNAAMGLYVEVLNKAKQATKDTTTAFEILHMTGALTAPTAVAIDAVSAAAGKLYTVINGEVNPSLEKFTSWESKASIAADTAKKEIGGVTNGVWRLEEALGLMDGVALDSSVARVLRASSRELSGLTDEVYRFAAASDIGLQKGMTPEESAKRVAAMLRASDKAIRSARSSVRRAAEPKGEEWTFKAEDFTAYGEEMTFAAEGIWDGLSKIPPLMDEVRNSSKTAFSEMSQGASELTRGMQQFADVTASALDAAISGESSFAAAMQDGTNAVLRGLAKQATARALMEGALALGALALGDTKQAGLHGAAAAKFALVAGVGFAGASAVGTSDSGDNGSGGSSERASAGQGLSAIAPAGSANNGQRTEIYNITIQGSLIRQAELGTAVGRALDEARRRGAAPRR